MELACGHDKSNLITTVETQTQYCGLCDLHDRLRDAETQEKELLKEKSEMLAFLKRAADGKHRIVSSGDLTTPQIYEAQASKRFYIEPGGGLGWALLPWELTTKKDREREADYFSRNNMMV